MFQGTKCNCRKELCYNEFYLGINVYRIYLHCKSCYAEITIKTDPKNCDYIVETGASRHFEPWRAQQVAQAMELKQQFSGVCTEKVEERTLDTQRDMEQKRDLGRLCALSNKQEKVDVSQIVVGGGEEERKETELGESDREKLERFEQLKAKASVKEVSLNRVGGRFQGNWGSRGLLQYADSDSDE
jgi:hypothetical protein